MIEAPTPDNEVLRQGALERYAILDTIPERSYDDITALIALLCDAPVSLVGLIDRERNWLKSHHGVPFAESPREISFCGHAIVSGQDLFMVEDARLDPRFADNPLVEEHGIVGYAGAPLIDADGFALGTLCVFNTRPMCLDEPRKEAIRAMARQVMYLLERHLRERRLEQSAAQLEARNQQLASFSGAVSHDIRSPLISIVELARVIECDAGQALDDEMREALRMLRERSVSLRDYLDGLLAHYTANEALLEAAETFRLDQVFDTIESMTVLDERTTLVLPRSRMEIHAHRAALQQILLNLISNAFRYGTGDSTRVEVEFVELVDGYRFHVRDDGPGIDPAQHRTIFHKLRTGGHAGRDGACGTGLGLATVTALLDGLDGVIELDSELGRGCTFSFTLPRAAGQLAGPPEIRKAA